MIAVAVAVLLVAPSTCPATDPKAELLLVHETMRQAHLQGDASMIAATTSDRLLIAENGGIRVQTNAEVTQFFSGYFNRVRYREWRDVAPPVVEVSPDGQMAWMAVGVEAHYIRADKPQDGEKSFKSSWIATFRHDKCEWRMTGIASDVVE
jgi:hypothetical protein